MSKCSLFLVDEDLFLNFLSSSYSLVIGIKTKLLKRGAKDATRMARSTQEHGIKGHFVLNYWAQHFSMQCATIVMTAHSMAVI